MRVILKNSETGRFLQPNGAWLDSKETAKDFASPVVSYWWALDRGLQSAEVWAAFDDPEDDFACIKVEPGLNRPIINCEQLDWQRALHWHLYNGLEVDLMDLDPNTQASDCELIAQAFEGQFGMVRDSVTKTAHFRKRPEWGWREPLDMGDLRNPALALKGNRRARRQ